jgi:hypothetical protein
MGREVKTVKELKIILHIFTKGSHFQPARDVGYVVEV